MAAYPSNMAPISVKLWENMFQTIPDISFFDAQNFGRFEFKNFGVDLLSRVLRFGGARNLSASLVESSSNIFACSSFIFSLRSLVEG